VIRCGAGPPLWKTSLRETEEKIGDTVPKDLLVPQDTSIQMELTPMTHHIECIKNHQNLVKMSLSEILCFLSLKTPSPFQDLDPKKSITESSLKSPISREQGPKETSFIRSKELKESLRSS
jgi:hypothetical protein